MSKKIQDKNLGYNLLKQVVRFLLYLFYGKIEVEGQKNVPTDKAVIFAPNHQNALMDALLVLYAQPGRIVFLARADIFHRKSIARILYILRILPVYRIRDGRDELSKNAGVFKQSIDVLRDGVPLCLMPEGRQSFKRQLSPLVKGMFRIAFQAQEELNQKEVVIVPVGIDYSNYVKPFAKVVVRFGTAVSAKQYQQLYEEQPAKALNKLRDEVSIGISSLTQDIRSEKHYYEFYGISRIEATPYCRDKGWKPTPLNLLRARREISLALDEQEIGDPEKAIQTCLRYAKDWPNLKAHEKEGEEFRSSILFVVCLIVLLLLLATAIILSLILALL